MKKTVIMMLVFVGLALQVRADEALQIMEAVDMRDDGTTLIGQVTMSTFGYGVQHGKTLATERPRVKKMTLVRKDYGPREKDHKIVSIIEEPKRDRGIGFLQYDYDEVGKETDQWLYLSALGKVKRIVSGNENEPKTGSYFGSEFNYEDLEAFRLDDYTYRLLGDDTVSGRACRIIEALPVFEKAKKSNYSRQVLWVDTGYAMVVKAELYDRKGKQNKTMYWPRIETIGGIHVARVIVVDNTQDLRRTVMVYDGLSLNRPVDDEFLTVRTLTDTGYRERKLREYRE